MRKRLIGDHPAIGIRPIIDGRRGALGVRELLEEQTINMAYTAKHLFEQNLRYTDGTPVRVLIADTTIGRVAEAAACEAKFRREGVAVTLSVTPCWCYGSETMDMDKETIKGVWGFNATERPVRYIWRVCLPHTLRRGCRPSEFTATRFRSAMTPRLPQIAIRAVAEALSVLAQ